MRKTKPPILPALINAHLPSDFTVADLLARWDSQPLRWQVTQIRELTRCEEFPDGIEVSPQTIANWQAARKAAQRSTNPLPQEQAAS